MASVNKVMIIGNLGKDPEMRSLPSGEQVATFSVATTETWKDKSGGKQERTDWHRIEFIGRTAEVCGEYLKKGSPVYVEGRIQYDKWTDKDGVEKTLTKIRGDRMQMLGSRNGGGGGNDHGDGDDEHAASSKPAPSASRPAPKAKSLDFDDDIPF
jgi:single-strand DNA-binding protein